MIIDYASAPVAVRADLTDAHRRYWERLARPGAWWNAAERVAIAAQARAARDCELCASRKAALSPSAAPGRHDADALLPDAAVDAVHRIATDAARLTRSWYEGLLDTGFTEGHYVELLGTVVSVISIDAFCRAVGVPPHPLPAPLEGAPSGYRPPSLERDADAWVPMVPLDNEATPEADLWVSGRTGYVIRAMSLVPDEVRTLADLSAAHYLPHRDVRRHGHTAGGPLTRSQMELVAAKVSLDNACFY